MKRGNEVPERAPGDHWIEQLRRKLPERVHARVWLAPLSIWLKSWPQMELASFSTNLMEIDPITTRVDSAGSHNTDLDCHPLRLLGLAVSEPAPWVVAVLPNPTWASSPSTAPLQAILLASSRIGNWNERHDLAIAVRHRLSQLSVNACLITAEGMTCQRMSIHASHYFGLACWEWQPAAQKSWPRWLDRLSAASHENSGGTRQARLFVTPTLDQPAVESPLADRLAFATARQICLLSLRPDGHTWNLANAALEQDTRPGRVQVYLPPCDSRESNALEQHRTAAQRLMSVGAVGWHVASSLVDVSTALPSSSVLDQNYSEHSPTVTNRLQWLKPSAPPTNRSEDESEPNTPSETSEYLVHHTRGNPQQWPEEVEGDFWWRWLTDGPTTCWPWETLLRIACQQKIRAGGRLIPGQKPVVCFSARCPAATAALRTFRPHLRRWDYEPYGVAIQRTWLEQRGARPVEYLEVGRPTDHFQQIRYSIGPAATRIDWSLEQEYRFEGDLDLRTVPPEAMFYFVRTKVEAQRLANYTTCRVKFLELQPEVPNNPTHPSLH